MAATEISVPPLIFNTLLPKVTKNNDLMSFFQFYKIVTKMANQYIINPALFLHVMSFKKADQKLHPPPMVQKHQKKKLQFQKRAPTQLPQHFYLLSKHVYL